jgi:hypothetical protein
MREGCFLSFLVEAHIEGNEQDVAAKFAKQGNKKGRQKDEMKRTSCRSNPQAGDQAAPRITRQVEQSRDEWSIK